MSQEQFCEKNSGVLVGGPFPPMFLKLNAPYSQSNVKTSRVK